MKGVQVSAPRFEHHHNGLGVDTSTPRISWSFKQLNDSCNNWQQTAYEIEVSFKDSGTSFTYTVSSRESICVPWPARPLNSREDARVRVRCSGSADPDSKNAESSELTEWSGWSVVEAALLSPSDWTARWTAPLTQENNEDGSIRPIRLARAFGKQSTAPVRRARLYITAHGCYHATINGQRVGDQCMAPGWQSYKHRLHYQVFDVSELLSKDSENVIDVQIGPGWYASALAWAGGRRCFFGDKLGLLAQLVLDHEDGSTSRINTDEKWISLKSPILSSEIYAGEVYDTNSDQNAADLLFDNHITSNVQILEPPTSKLISPDAPPVRVTQEVPPQKIFRSGSGKVLIDFGQNLVGCLKVISLKKPSGTIVSFAHAEVLENNELGRRPLRNATSTDTVICDGRELKNWSPMFTFHGFRYVEVTGWSPDDATCPLDTNSLVAQVMHTDMRRTGHFECSHPMINKLHENATWGMRGNFLSVPTDCPQRDERLGWTGDIQVFAPSANFLYDTTGILGNWLEDLAAEQLSPEHNGVPPFVVPDVISKAHEGDDAFWPKLPNAVWDDVAVLLPWELWQASGDPAVLRKQYESMQAWLNRGIQRGVDRLWDPEIYQLGDWLDPIAPPSEPGNGRTDGTLVADAYLVHITQRMAEVARTLNKPEVASRYAEDYELLLQRFQEKYMTSSGLLASDTQTAYALAITFNLFSTPVQFQNASTQLARSVRKQQFRVSTGFAGTPLILHALTAAGHSNLAYRMLLEKRCPSWMYAVSMGATTIWERWDSMLPDGSINPGEMTSFNHYALGSVVSWLHGSVGGIGILKEGWREILVKPVPGGGLSWAKVRFEGPYGEVGCEWQVEGELFRMTVWVPPGRRAKIVLPGKSNGEQEGCSGNGIWVGSGKHQFECQYESGAWPPQALMPPFWPQPPPICS